MRSKSVRADGNPASSSARISAALPGVKWATRASARSSQSRLRRSTDESGSAVNSRRAASCSRGAAEPVAEAARLTPSAQSRALWTLSWEVRNPSYSSSSRRRWSASAPSQSSSAARAATTAATQDRAPPRDSQSAFPPWEPERTKLLRTSGRSPRGDAPLRSSLRRRGCPVRTRLALPCGLGRVRP